VVGALLIKIIIRHVGSFPVQLDACLALVTICRVGGTVVADAECSEVPHVGVSMRDGIYTMS